MKAAHFENIPEKSIYDLYVRHAEVARDIHQKVASEYAGQSIEVDLINLNGVSPDDATLDKMSEYDVVSVSSTFSTIGQHFVSFGDRIPEIMERFETGMPVYVVSAGNEGNTDRTNHIRISDFVRNGVAVGEANVSEGEAYIESHSSLNPTLTASSPFNEGEKFHVIETAPSLEGHEDLIRKWIFEGELSERMMKFGEDLEVEEFWKKHAEIQKVLRESEDFQKHVNERTEFYMNNPEALHEKIHEGLRVGYDYDENGYLSHIDGTSFSGPYKAAHITGALKLEEQRELEGLPILTPEEIVSIGKLATVNVEKREGSNEPMFSHSNEEGFEFTSYGGHGVFDPALFRDLIDEAHSVIETNPDIDREIVTRSFEGDIKRSHKIEFEPSDRERGQIIVEKAVMSIDYRVQGLVPHVLEVQVPGQEQQFVRLSNVSGSSGMFGYFSTDKFFGEDTNPRKSWDAQLQVERGTEVEINEAKLVLYGYNRDGLMDQLFEKRAEMGTDLEHSQVLENKAEAEPSSSLALNSIPNI